MNVTAQVRPLPRRTATVLGINFSITSNRFCKAIDTCCFELGFIFDGHTAELLEQLSKPELVYKLTGCASSGFAE
jgi:hypothetical protein